VPATHQGHDSQLNLLAFAYDDPFDIIGQALGGLLGVHGGSWGKGSPTGKRRAAAPGFAPC